MKNLTKTLAVAASLVVLATTAFAHPEKEVEVEKTVIVKKIENNDISVDAPKLGDTSPHSVNLDNLGLDILENGDIDFDALTQKLKARSAESADSDTKILIIKDGDASEWIDETGRDIRNQKHHMNEDHRENMPANGEDDADMVDAPSERIIIKKYTFDEDEIHEQKMHGREMDGHKKDGHAGEKIKPDSEENINVFVSKTGDVTVLKDGQLLLQSRHDEQKVNINKQVTIENGKRKTHIVIDIESDE